VTQHKFVRTCREHGENFLCYLLHTILQLTNSLNRTPPPLSLSNHLVLGWTNEFYIPACLLSLHSRYSDLLQAGRFEDRMLVGNEVFRTRPDRPWGPLSLLHKGYRVYFQAVKRPGHGISHPLPSSAEVKERVEIYLYSISGHSWHVLGQTLPFFYHTD